MFHFCFLSANCPTCITPAVAPLVKYIDRQTMTLSKMATFALRIMPISELDFNTTCYIWYFEWVKTMSQYETVIACKCCQSFLQRQFCGWDNISLLSLGQFCGIETMERRHSVTVWWSVIVSPHWARLAAAGAEKGFQCQPYLIRFLRLLIFAKFMPCRLHTSILSHPLALVRCVTSWGSVAITPNPM